MITVGNHHLGETVLTNFFFTIPYRERSIVRSWKLQEKWSRRETKEEVTFS